MALYLRIPLALFLGAMLTAGWTWWHILPQPGAQSHALRMPANRYQVISGNAILQADRLHIEGASGKAVVSIPVPPFRAEEYPFLLFDLEDNRPTEDPPLFFWRRTGQKNVNTAPVEMGITRVVDLGKQEKWQGIITEIGFMLPLATTREWELGETRLLPHSRKWRLSSLLNQWSNPILWSQHSAHFLRGDKAPAPVSLQSIVMIWVLISLAILLSLPGKRKLHLAIPVVLLAGWAVLDARWLNTLWHNGLTSWNSFAPYREEEKYHAAIERKQYALTRKILTLLPPDKPETIYLPTDPSPAMRYFYGKLPYFLAPHRVRTLQPETQNGYIVVLSRSSSHYDATTSRLEIGGIRRDGVTQLLHTPVGSLYLLGHQETADKPLPTRR